MPLGFFDEDVCFLSQNGRLVHVPLPSYAFRSVTKQFITSRHQNSIDAGIESMSEANRAPDVRFEKLQAERNKLSDNDVSHKRRALRHNLFCFPQLAMHFENALNVGAFEDALVLADFLQRPERWRQLAKTCISFLEFDLGVLAAKSLYICF